MIDGGVESVRTGKCQNHFFAQIGKCQNWKVSEFLEIEKCQNFSKSESVRIQEWHSKILKFYLT